jgi:hypothetical protein
MRCGGGGFDRRLGRNHPAKPFGPLHRGHRRANQPLGPVHDRFGNQRPVGLGPLGTRGRVAANLLHLLAQTHHPGRVQEQRRRIGRRIVLADLRRVRLKASDLSSSRGKNLPATRTTDGGTPVFDLAASGHQLANLLLGLLGRRILHRAAAERAINI